jgi:serine/threonine-protein kinase
VTGLSEEEATAMLEASGFKVQVQETEVFDAAQDGFVSAQHPPANSDAKTGSTVTITVGRFTGQTTTP